MSASSTSVIDVQSKHVTVRSFLDSPIEPAMLQSILQGARRSPTSSNMQAYSILVIRDPETKKELAKLAGNQKHIESCPVFLVFCADLNRLGHACEMHGVQMQNNLETFLISTIDAALVGMSTQTAAESHGLGGVMIGALRNHPQKVAELLGLPKGVYGVFGMCLGWPDPEKIPAQKPRLPETLVIHEEKYSNQDPVELLSQHDNELRKHYEDLGHNLDIAAWSGVISRNLSRPARPQNIDIFEGMGFHICHKPHE